MLTRSTIAALVALASITTADAASICKGLTQETCGNPQVAGVPVCRWQGEYFTTGGQRGNYCTTSNKKLTKAQFQQLQQALNDGTLLKPAAPAN